MNDVLGLGASWDECDAAKAGFECATCHTPYVDKSAVSISIETAGGAAPKGDIRPHIFRINGDANWNMFTDDGSFVRFDNDGEAHLGLEYTCLTCHTNKDKTWAAANAAAIHHGVGSSMHSDDLTSTVP